MLHAWGQGLPGAIQLYNAIQYTAIQRYTLYNLYTTPLWRDCACAQPNGDAARRGPRREWERIPQMRAASPKSKPAATPPAPTASRSSRSPPARYARDIGLPQVCARDAFNGAGRPRAHTGGRVWFEQARVCARKGRHRGSSHTSKNFCDHRCLCRMLHTCRRITSAPMVALMLLSGDHEFARCRVFHAFGL